MTVVEFLAAQMNGVSSVRRLASSNAIRVNGKSVNNLDYPLASGDLVQVGKHWEARVN